MTVPVLICVSPPQSSDIRRRLSTDQLPMPPGLPTLNPGSTTPCSGDTGFGDQRLDSTPSSMGGPYTPGSTSSQGGGTPYTPRSGTPFSQDSGYGVGRYCLVLQVRLICGIETLARLLVYGLCLWVKSDLSFSSCSIFFSL